MCCFISADECNNIHCLFFFYPRLYNHSEKNSTEKRMNFKKQEKKIKKLLVLSEKRQSETHPTQYRYQYQKGVYVISKDLDDTHHKIGMAHGSGGLFNRLKSYKICWPYPKEYYLQYLFICNSTNARLLEKKILARTDKLKHIEKAEDVGEEKDEGRHSLEWRFTSKRDILNATLIDELNANPKLWDYAVIFGDKGWKIRVSPEKITNFQRPASSRDERPDFGEVAKPDTFIPDVVRFEPIKGKFAWVVNQGRKKGTFKALKGKIDRFDSNEIWLTFPNYKDAFAYKKKDVFKTKAEADEETKKY